MAFYRLLVEAITS